MKRSGWHILIYKIRPSDNAQLKTVSTLRRTKRGFPKIPTRTEKTIYARTTSREKASF